LFIPFAANNCQFELLALGAESVLVISAIHDEPA